jgi:hypothetical protein
MDGFDLYEMLNREIPLTEVLDRKIRQAPKQAPHSSEFVIYFT